MDRVSSSGSASYFYVHDALGSVIELVNSNGIPAERYIYDPFGNVTIRSNAGRIVENPYLFTGREFDAESGLYHFRARAYDPRIGRFLQRDPTGFEGGTNLYEYAHNNPTNYIDPDGEIAVLALLPVVYAAIEIGLSISDAYSTGQTLLDSSKSGGEKALSAGLFIVGALAPGGGYSSALNFTKGQFKQFEKQLMQHGKKSLEKSLESLEKKLATHQKKVEEIKKIGGYTSSVKKEINNFTQQINAIKKILGG